MGMISGLVCSPCTNTALPRGLIYVAQSGDPGFGGAAPSCPVAGMGLLLLLLGTSGALPPQAGA